MTDAGVFDPLAWWGRHDPARIAVQEWPTASTYSYGTLDAAAEAWAASLRHDGVAAGDRVAILARNSAAHLALLAACARVGAILVPLNWRLAAPELARVLRDCTPRVLFTDGVTDVPEPAAPVVRDLADGFRAMCAAPDARPSALRPRASVVRSAAPAMLLYTSGTTGAAKGVIVPHAQCHANAAATGSAWGLHGAHTALVMSPFFHTAGWGVFALPLLRAGGRLVVLAAFDAPAAFAAMREHAVTHVFGVPTQWQDLVAVPEWGAPLPRLQWLLTGGAPCPRRLHEQVVQGGYAFREGFGLTECGPNCFTITDERAARFPGAVGDLMPGIEGRLVDADGGLIDAPDAPGELQLRGPQLFGGYWNNAAATADAMTADGWLRTGDVLSWQPEAGWRVRGRTKEMYISGGENVFPGEVEAALLETGEVAACCVVGVPDPRWGEVGAACVVPVDGRSLDVEHLRRRLRALLAAYKVPRDVVCVDALPRLGSGKVDRAAVARRVADAAPR